jgi:hypothetical protein
VFNDPSDLEKTIEAKSGRLEDGDTVSVSKSNLLIYFWYIDAVIISTYSLDKENCRESGTQ